MVFDDRDNDATVDTGEDILRVSRQLSRGITVKGETGVSSYVSYSSDGRARLTNGTTQSGTISLCAAGSDSSTQALIDANQGKMNAIELNPVGRARVVRRARVVQSLTPTSVTCP
jgi:type IV fimbrial biogenesis protein FimT